MKLKLDKNDNLLNLDAVAQPNECTEILADNILDYIPTNNMYDVLKHYASKLRHNGKLIISGTDIVLVAKDIVTQRLNLVEANKIIYGDRTEVKSGMISMFDIIPLIESIGLKVMKKSYNDYIFTLEAVRP